MVFEPEYAAVYDLLYQDKDYAGECSVIEKLFESSVRCPRTVLDLGCGTGGHALVLAKLGYKVTGIDRSPGMLDIARQKAHSSGADVEFVEGDIDTVGLGRKFDAVIAMFAVMGYQTTDSAVTAACRRAREALAHGGLFIFDCWNGQAVLAEGPSRRVKKAQMTDGRTVTRTTVPELDVKERVVRVHFTVSIEGMGAAAETRETHIMRFFFPEEIKQHLRAGGFEHMDVRPFPDVGRPLRETDWNMVVIGR